MTFIANDPGLIVAGIDPGVRGALAILNESDDCDTVAMPVMGDPKIVDGGAVVRWISDRDANLAVIELAHAMPKQGVVSSFRFGMVYGQLLGALQASLIPYRIVTANRWKKDLRLSFDKEQSRRRAIEVLPQAAQQFQMKQDEARAEAALIAWWYLHERSNGSAGKGEKSRHLVS